MKKNILRKLITIRMEDDPQEVAAGLLDVLTSGESDEARAEAAGDVIDKAIVFSGPVGGLLEGLDDAAAERLAGVALELAGQARIRALEEIDARIARLDISIAVKTELREALKLDELAA